MANTISTILIVLLLFGGLLFYFRRKGMLPNWLSNLFAPSRSQTIAKLKIETERELQKASHLKEVFDAKRKLMEAKALSNNLQQDIHSLNQDNVALIANKYPFENISEEKDKQEAKVS